MIEYLIMAKKSRKTTKNPNEILILCDCRSEILRIEYDPEIGMAEFAMYSNGYSMSLWQKVRYIWELLIRGKPFSDQTMLNKTQIKDLAKFLNSVL